MSGPTAYGKAKIKAACEAAFAHGGRVQTRANRYGLADTTRAQLEANRTENALAEYVAQLEAVAAHHVAGEQVKQDAVDAIREATTQYWAKFDAGHPGAVAPSYDMPEDA